MKENVPLRTSTHISQSTNSTPQEYMVSLCSIVREQLVQPTVQQIMERIKGAFCLFIVALILVGTGLIWTIWSRQSITNVDSRVINEDNKVIINNDNRREEHYNITARGFCGSVDVHPRS